MAAAAPEQGLISSAAAAADQDEEEPPASLGQLREELRAGILGLRASVRDVSDALRDELQHQLEVLQDVRLAVGGLRGACGHAGRGSSCSSLPCRHSDRKPSPLPSSAEPGADARMEPPPFGGTASVGSMASSLPDVARVYSSGSLNDNARSSLRAQWQSEGGLGALTSNDELHATFSRAWVTTKTKLFVHRYAMYLDFFVGFVILINSVCIGIEIQHSLDGVKSPAMRLLEHIFLIIFTLELCLRTVANDQKYLWSGWFVLEAGLIAAGVATTWILEPIMQASDNSDAMNAVDQVLILRVLRLLRLARAARLFQLCDMLWKLSNGLLKSVKTVLTACILVLAITYMFACLGVESITSSSALRSNRVTDDIVSARFGSLPRTLLTLLSFTNQDSIAAIYEPIIAEEPVFAVFFGLVWLFVTVSLMNLVTAVIVDTAIWQSRADDEQKHLDLRRMAKKLVPEIRQLFDTLDINKDGLLQRSELKLKGIMLPPGLQNVIDEGRLKDLFHFLDIDGSNTIEKDEFVDGIMHLTVQDVPIETTQMLQLLRLQKRGVDDILGVLSEVRRGLKRYHRESQRESLRACAEPAAGAACHRMPITEAGEVADEGPCTCPASRSAP